MNKCHIISQKLRDVNIFPAFNIIKKLFIDRSRKFTKANFLNKHNFEESYYWSIGTFQVCRLTHFMIIKCQNLKMK